MRQEGNKRRRRKSKNNEVKRILFFCTCFAFLFGTILIMTAFIFIESKPWKRGKRTRTVVYTISPKDIDRHRLTDVNYVQIRSLNQLLALPPDELEEVDIGLMNLLCAQGLKGADNLDIDKCLAILDEWAETVGADIEKLLPKYNEHPEQYDNSENMFRVVTMCYGLKHLFRIHYNLENMKDMDYSDSSQIFIHGLLGDKREGSCVSLPVVCTAVGRRLGYPLKLVETGLHLFIRWDDDKTGERFNIEVACPGVQTPPDEEYMERPRKLSNLELKRGRFLKSFTAADALSFFLVCRGHNLADCDRICEAQIAFAYAYSYSPDYVNNIIPLAVTVDAELRRMWLEDCELMKTDNIRYTSWSGLRIDKQLPIWSYPPVPGPEFFNKLRILQQELAKERMLNNRLPEDTDGLPDFVERQRHTQEQMKNPSYWLNQQQPANPQDDLMRKTTPPGTQNSGQQ